MHLVFNYYVYCYHDPIQLLVQQSINFISLLGQKLYILLKLTNMQYGIKILY